MKKVTLLLLTLIMVSVPMHLLTAQTMDRSGQAMNPDLMFFMLSGDSSGMTDADSDGGMMGDDMMSDGMMGDDMMSDGMMGDDMMSGDMMGNGMMGCGMMHGGMMGRGMKGYGMMHGGMMGMHSGVMMGLRAYAMFIQVRNALGITQDQMQKIQSAILDHIRTVAPIEANIKIGKAETFSLLIPLLDVQGSNIDMNAVDQKIHNVKKLEADKAVASIKTIVNIKGILTKEQLQRLQTFLLDMVNKMHGGKKMMKGNQCQQPQQPQQPQPSQQPNQ